MPESERRRSSPTKGSNQKTQLDQDSEPQSPNNNMGKSPSSSPEINVERSQDASSTSSSRSGNRAVSERSSPPDSPAATKSGDSSSARSSGGLAAAFLGAVIGGIVVAAAGYYYLDQYLGIEPEFRERLDTVAENIGTLQSASTSNIESITALSDRIGSIEATVDNEVTQPQSEGVLQSMQRISQIADDLTSRLDTVETVRQEDLETIESVQNNLAALVQSFETLSSNQAELSPLSQQLEAAVGTLAALNTTVESTTEVTNSKLSDIETEIGNLQASAGLLKTSMNALEGDIISAKHDASKELDALDQRLLAMQENRDELLTAAIALGDLQSARYTGAPLDETLATMSAASADGSPIQEAANALRPFAARGIPTIETLRSGLDDIRAELASQSAPSSTDSWLQRTEQNITQLIRPTSTSGTSKYRDALDNAEASLADGGLSDAISAVEPMAEDGLETAKEWIANAKARLASETAVETLDAVIRNQTTKSN